MLLDLARYIGQIRFRKLLLGLAYQGINRGFCLNLPGQNPANPAKQVEQVQSVGFEDCNCWNELFSDNNLHVKKIFSVNSTINKSI